MTDPLDSALLGGRAAPTVLVLLGREDRAALDSAPLATVHLEAGPVRARVLRRVVYALTLIVPEGEDRGVWVDDERVTP